MAAWTWGAADGEWVPSSDDWSSDEEDSSIENRPLWGDPAEELLTSDLSGEPSGSGVQEGGSAASLVTSDVRERFAAYLELHYERVFQRTRWYQVSDVLCAPFAGIREMGIAGTGFMGSLHARDSRGGSRFYTMRMATAEEARGKRVVKLAVKAEYGRGLTTVATDMTSSGYTYALHRGVPAGQIAEKPVECRAISEGEYRVGDMRIGQFCRVVSGRKGVDEHGFVCVVYVDTCAFKDFPLKPINSRGRPGKRERAFKFDACVDVRGKSVKLAHV